MLRHFGSLRLSTENHPENFQNTTQLMNCGASDLVWDGTKGIWTMDRYSRLYTHSLLNNCCDMSQQLEPCRLTDQAVTFFGFFVPRRLSNSFTMEIQKEFLIARDLPHHPAQYLLRQVSQEIKSDQKCPLETIQRREILSETMYGWV